MESIWDVDIAETRAKTRRKEKGKKGKTGEKGVSDENRKNKEQEAPAEMWEREKEAEEEGPGMGNRRSEQGNYIREG